MELGLTFTGPVNYAVDKVPDRSWYMLREK